MNTVKSNESVAKEGFINDVKDSAKEFEPKVRAYLDKIEKRYISMNRAKLIVKDGLVIGGIGFAAYHLWKKNIVLAIVGVGVAAFSDFFTRSVLMSASTLTEFSISAMSRKDIEKTGEESLKKDLSDEDC